MRTDLLWRSVRERTAWLAVCACAAAVPGQAAAQEGRPGAGAQAGWSVQLGGGFITRPDYTGSDDYETDPVPLIRISHPSGFFVRYPQGIGYELIQRGNVTAGAAVSYGGGRDNDGDLALLEEVDAGALGNLFVEYQLGPVTVGAMFSAPLSGDTEGSQVSLGAGYRSALTRKLFYTVGTRLQWNSDGWNDSLFSLSPGEAARLGVTPYSAASGLSEASLGGTLTYTLSGSWSLTAVGGVSRLLGDPADNPIVADLGDATQLTGALLLGYGF
ncbi:MAG TPA: MipA/OmpV family protein [Arenicellales bacterium]|nr:MipA/OmpV family protein [Arenicellales bacterium]